MTRDRRDLLAALGVDLALIAICGGIMLRGGGKNLTYDLFIYVPAAFVLAFALVALLPLLFGVVWHLVKRRRNGRAGAS